ncbi:hypothetical protein AWC38_SpisGene7068 [Stylophora pistillata]|uniref:Pectate lyase superfamily protein domain-containing protein n=1 Tax=Stylophora pistillata TaxID=50429 RepID=A0A2B4SI62_STYPI|nr:hypothetical protein AWC38_SpisGene7068 [Stylophora pistillata]
MVRRIVLLFVSIVLALRMGNSSARKPSVELNFGQRTLIHHNGARQNVMKKKSGPNYLKGSDDVPAGMTNVKQPGGSLTAGVGDGQTDDTSAIQAIVDHVAGSNNNKVFFPRGFFKSCLYSQCDKRIKIAENIFNGSPNTAGLHRDHAVYVKGFDDLEVKRNFARSWPSNSSGGIKARNGKNLWVARNYLDDVSILLYTYSKRKACLYDGLKNAVVYGNHIVDRTNYNGPKSKLGYFEPHNAGKDENIRYSANVFEIIGAVRNSTKYACIWLTSGNLSEHHVYTDNVYYGTTTPVMLEARNATASYDAGNIGQEIKDLYNYPAYKLDIPPY